MKFKNKITKVILETNSAFVIEQLTKSGDYEEVKEVLINNEIKNKINNKISNKRTSIKEDK